MVSLFAGFDKISIFCKKTKRFYFLTIFVGNKCFYSWQRTVFSLRISSGRNEH